jgi:hypothetical protein
MDDGYVVIGVQVENESILSQSNPSVKYKSM